MNQINNFKVSGYELDIEQKKVVFDDSKNVLTIAGAGSGKSLTIVGKVKHLINDLNYKEDEILCISFTNEACKSLKRNINKNGYNVNVLTFHKLALSILKSLDFHINIAPSDLLEYVIKEFFEYLIFQEEYYIKLVLKYYDIRFNRHNFIFNYKNLLLKKTKIEILIKLISSFICLFKANGFSYDYLKYVFLKEKSAIRYIFSKKNLYLLNLIVKILYEYDSELKANCMIDFDDMIKIATDLAINNMRYRYIIIDEFQDTSLLRYNLIKKLIKIYNANFLAVGDDYQSIYRFTGCDLNLFLKFENYFDNPKIYKIQTTYRNSNELNAVAEKFITKNKMQIKKKLHSNLSNKKPIKIIFYNNQGNKFIRLLDYMYKLNKKKLLILMRNNDDIKSLVNDNFIIEGDIIKYKKHIDLFIRFLTVHSSKGLEEENVIVISLEDKLCGFPNKIENTRLMKNLFSKSESYLYSEERRLFYVALTRTKNDVYLLVSKKSPSIFVKELMRDSYEFIEKVLL